MIELYNISAHVSMKEKTKKYYDKNILMVLHIVLQVTTYKHCNTLVKGHFYKDLYWKGFIDNKYSVKIIVIIILPLRLNHGLFENYNK